MLVTRLLLFFCPLMTWCAHAQTMGGSCAEKSMMQIRVIILRAITDAKAALAREKRLNEYLYMKGHDEEMNQTPHMPKTCHQHYAAFAHLNIPASIQIDSGYIIQYATKAITQTLGVSVDELYQCPSVLEIWHELISPFCVCRDAICDASAKYRNIDGSCNNLYNPQWGRSNRPHLRFLKPQYMDDIGMPRQRSVTGGLLPSARTVSNAVHDQDQCCPLQERDLSLFVMQWGQMIDHDVTDTAIARGASNASIICCNLTREVLMQRSGCFPIDILPGDKRFGEPCMNFVRSVAGHSDNCGIGRRNQLNQATSFLDASFLYGHNDEDANKIRSFRNGRLRITRLGFFPGGLEDLTHCELENEEEYCMKSGDFRIHILPGLTAVQVMFLREHNRVAGILQQMNPRLRDEDIYQEARKIVIGDYQHITYAKWLPYVIGNRLTMQTGLAPVPMGHSNVYDILRDPTISNIFGAAAFRFGHSLVQNTVLYLQDEGELERNELHFNRPEMIFRDNGKGCNFAGHGLAQHASSKADEKIVDSVRNYLFLDMNGRSFDLISLNIQRGRDHGVPGYNDWRRYCGLPYAVHFGTQAGGLVDVSPENARKLYWVYRHPDDIDVFSGGISETPVSGGLVGPLFSCIIGQQFHNLKYGDRFYYETNDRTTGFNEYQLNSIKKISLAKLMCLHFKMPHVQMNPFRLPGPKIHILPGLTAVQVMFLREHNRVAGILQQMNPRLRDEDIYQEARKIVIGDYQHITYAKWLPYVIGNRLTMQTGLAPVPMGHSNVYDILRDPTISNIFGAAAFRFGHSLVQNTVLYLQDEGELERNELHFNRPEMIFRDNGKGCNFAGHGLAQHASSKADEKIVDSVRNYLFLDMNGRSFDLISLNIQRGRDHGVPGYNDWRRYCGLPYAVHFGTQAGGLVDVSPENARKLYWVYRHPDDIDVFSGGISETPVSGGLVGPLFSCIIGQQFHNLKYGDRFYYETNDRTTGFNEYQLNSIKKISLAKLMCLHFKMPHVQMNPFRLPGPNNPVVNCRVFEDIDFSLWQM